MMVHKGPWEATLILEATCAGPNRLSDLVGHPWPPKVFLY